MFALQTNERLGHGGTAQLQGHFLGEAQIPVSVSPSQPGFLVHLRELCAGILPHGFQQVIARLAVRLGDRDQGLVRQLGEEVQDREPVNGIC